MFNSTNGAFGAPPGFQDYTNLAGLKYAGADKAPDLSRGMASNLQFAFNTPSYYSPTLNYQSPAYTMKDYGVIHSFKADTLGLGYGYGHNALEYQQGKKEYKALVWNGFKGVAADMVGSAAIASQVASPIASIPAALIGGAASSLLWGVRADNYKESQFANYLTGDIMNEDGGMGFTGKQNTRLAKQIRRIATEDSFMDTEDFQNILSTYKQAGGFQQDINPVQMKEATKKLHSTIKSLSSFFGSSDLKGLTKAVADFQRLGFSQTEASSMLKSGNAISRIAGVTMKEVNNIGNAYIAMSDPKQNKMFTKKTADEDILTSSSLYKMGNLGTQFNDKKVLQIAQQNVRKMFQSQSSSMTGLNRTQTMAMLIGAAKEEGIKGKDFSKYYHDYMMKTSDEKVDFIRTNKYASSSKNMAQYMDTNMSSSIVSHNKDYVGAMDLENEELISMSKRVVDFAKKNGFGTKRDGLRLAATNLYSGTDGFDADSLSLLVDVSETAISKGSYKFINQGRRIQKSLVKASEMADGIRGFKDRHGFLAQAKVEGGRLYDDIVDTAGYWMSEALQDDYRKTINPADLSAKRVKKARIMQKNRSAASFLDLVSDFGSGEDVSGRLSGVISNSNLKGLDSLVSGSIGMELVNSVSSGEGYSSFKKRNRNSTVSESDYLKLKTTYSMFEKKRFEIAKRRSSDFRYSGFERDDIEDEEYGDIVENMFGIDNEDKMTRVMGSSILHSVGASPQSRGASSALIALQKAGFKKGDVRMQTLQAAIASGASEETAKSLLETATGESVGSGTMSMIKHAMEYYSKMSSSEKDDAKVLNQVAVKKEMKDIVRRYNMKPASVPEESIIEMMTRLSPEQLNDIKAEGAVFKELATVEQAIRKKKTILKTKRKDSLDQSSEGENALALFQKSIRFRGIGAREGLMLEATLSNMTNLSDDDIKGKADELGLSGKAREAFVRTAKKMQGLDSDELELFKNAFTNDVRAGDDTNQVIAREVQSKFGVSSDLVLEMSKSKSFKDFKKLHEGTDVTQSLFEDITESFKSYGDTKDIASELEGKTDAEMTAKVVDAISRGSEEVVKAIDNVFSF